jgi:ferredoxin-nitrate reductase
VVVLYRQLDKLGSEMLHHEIVDLGIEVFYNDEVSSIYGTDQLEGVRLKSGRRIDAQVAVFAIGTTPNTEIAKAAGLEVNVEWWSMIICKRLILLFAAGEMAQWRGEMWVSRLLPSIKPKLLLNILRVTGQVITKVRFR